MILIPIPAAKRSLRSCLVVDDHDQRVGLGLNIAVDSKRFE